MKRLSTQHVLIFLIVGLSLWIGITQKWSHKNVTAFPNQILNIHSDDIHTLEVDSFKGAYTLSRRNPNRQWQLIAPYQAKVQQEFLNMLAKVFEPLVAQRIILEDAKDADLKTYGLKTPLLSLNISTDSGSYRLDIGRIAPTEDVYYAKMSNVPKVFVIEKEVVLAIFKDASGYQDSKLFPVTWSELHSLEWQYKDQPKIRLEKTETGWSIEEPLQFPLTDRFEIRYFAPWTDLEFQTDVYDQEANFDDPTLVLTYQKEGEELAQTIRVGKLEPQVQAYPIRLTSSQKTHLLGERYVDLFNVAVTDLMDTRIYPFTKDQIATIEAHSMGQLLWKAVQKDSQQWLLYGDDQNESSPANHKFHLLLSLLDQDVFVKHLSLDPNSLEGDATLQLLVTTHDGQQFGYDYYNRNHQWLLKSDGHVLLARDTVFTHALDSLEQLIWTDSSS